ncbi:hypothetical protein SAMN05660199_03673 [Klenkia soli]|uniref:Uncharacterized protein n=1 Tax=Klenkia soli TaxID=1052260 RepID=A0A1H0RYB3_9ACTN|nr:hypothetical protein [Klenkia soli]SDP34319.1 hypothetical protein SAMN05660199_03673 [Klenkia soli]
MTVGPLAVRADLTLQAGGTTARLTGDGADLVLASTDPIGLWRAVTDLPWPAGATARSGPRAVGELAGLLAAQGLHVDVTGPHGRVAELGAGVSSPLGRALTGSSAVRAGSARTVLATVPRGPRWGLLAGAALVVLLALRRASGGRSR